MERSKAIEDCICWAAQQGYAFAKTAAEAYGKPRGLRMVNERPYYGSYVFIDAPTGLLRRIFGKQCNLKKGARKCQ